MPNSKPMTCLFCRAPLPPGRVEVREQLNPWGGSRKVGYVCSGHTLAALILDPKERFSVDLWRWFKRSAAEQPS